MSIRSRTSKVTVGTILFVIATLNSPPGIPSVAEDRPAPPSLEEIAVLDELLGWLDTDSYSFRPTGFQAVRSIDMVEAVRDRHQSFRLFHSYNDRDQRLAALKGVPYSRLIARAARKYGIDELLLASVIEVESGFNEQAISPVGAIGLMQVMPDTAALYGYSDPSNPASNVDLGARYLNWLLEEFDGDLALALAAYNAGPGNVRRFGGLPPFRETQRYVRKVLGRYVDHHQRLWRRTGEDDLLLLEAQSLFGGSLEPAASRSIPIRTSQSSRLNRPSGLF